MIIRLSNKIDDRILHQNFKIPKYKVSLKRLLYPINTISSITTDFYVNGTKIPEVNFDVGPSWAGLLPISDKTNESRKLFFWYFPSETVEGMNDLVIWLNGGPGCSR